VRVRVAFGSGTVEVEVPAGVDAEVPPEPSPREEPAVDAVRRALDAPSGSPPLAARAAGARDAVVAVPDATRACPVGDLLPLVATGMHRAPTEAERAAMLAGVGGRGIRISAHDPRGPIRDLGAGPGGAPLGVAEAVAAAGIVVSLGVVEPHPCAGFSGGWKTVGIGCAGEATIAFTHAPRFLDHPRCRPGVLDRNPFAEVVRENARRAGLRFAVNLVPGPGGGVVAAGAGDPGVVHRLLAARARDACALRVKAPADCVLAGVGAPKDANLYQATRAATILVLGPVEAVRPGGTVIVAAPCPEGIGAGEGEKRFAAALRDGRKALLESRDRPFLAGEQRAYAVARAMAGRRIVIAGSGIPAADLEAMGFGSAPDAASALAAAVAAGARRLLVVPRAVASLPVPDGGRP